MLQVQISFWQYLNLGFKGATLLFEMFVIPIACDQFEAILSDEILVEEAKVITKDRESYSFKNKSVSDLILEYRFHL